MITSLPNILTLSRIVVIPLLVAAFYLPFPWSNWVALALFVGAGLTDFLDGHLARRWGEVSGLGRFLDPVADKLLIAATLVMLVHTDVIVGWAILPTIFILCREIMVSALREFLAELNVGVPVSRLAKWKTTVQLVAIGVLIAGDAAWEPLRAAEAGTAGLWLAALLTVYTGYDYMRAGLRHMTGEQPEPMQRQSANAPGAHPALKARAK